MCSYGFNHVDIAAPGRSILSSIPDNDYGYLDGTSQAAPHVAGVAALLMNKFPNLSVAQVVDRIKRTAMRMTTLDGMVEVGGMVDAEAALRDVSATRLRAASESGVITVFWDPVTGATRYEVERDGMIVNNGSATTHVHHGLLQDSGHIYRVRAFQGSSTGQWSHRLMAQASLMPTSEAVVLESPHPYPNDLSQGYTVSKPGASRLRVHFARLETLDGDTLEYLRVFQDERESIDEQLSGNYPNGIWTHWIDGDSFDFQLQTDASGRAFGFVVDRIEYFGAESEPDTVSFTLEAEDAALFRGAVENEHAGFSGTGYVNTDNVVGSFIEWTVEAPRRASAAVDARYALGAAARTVSLRVNGVVVNPALVFPATGEWTNWSSLSLTLSLVAGNNTIRFTSVTSRGGPNFDKIDVTRQRD